MLWQKESLFMHMAHLPHTHLNLFLTCIQSPQMNLRQRKCTVWTTAAHLPLIQTTHRPRDHRAPPIHPETSVTCRALGKRARHRLTGPTGWYHWSEIIYMKSIWTSIYFYFSALVSVLRPSWYSSYSKWNKVNEVCDTCTLFYVNTYIISVQVYVHFIGIYIYISVYCALDATLFTKSQGHRNKPLFTSTVWHHLNVQFPWIHWCESWNTTELYRNVCQSFSIKSL